MSDGLLPNPFLFSDGRAVSSPDDWQKRRQEIIELFSTIAYGPLPPTPRETSYELLHRSEETAWNGAHVTSLRVITGPQAPWQFTLKLITPNGSGPFPVILTGDGCWPNLSDEVIQEGLTRGYALALFNRTEIIPDRGQTDRRQGLAQAIPDSECGALAAWAWGYHRCLDVLSMLPEVDANRLAINGHSRGGKAALWAGATDERIALVGANNSGCGGAGCYRWQGPGSETLDDILKNFDYWFGPKLASYVSRETELPFDQHFLKALIAPRALLTTEALDDAWANPMGSWQSQQAAAEVYRFLGHPEHLQTHYRAGGHAHGFADWAVFFDFADWKFFQQQKLPVHHHPPFADLPTAFTWAAPKMGPAKGATLDGS